jgi:hypothetical protein
MDLHSQARDWQRDARSKISPEERRIFFRGYLHWIQDVINTRAIKLAPELAFHVIPMPWQSASVTWVGPQQPAPKVSVESKEKEEEAQNPVADLVLGTLQQAPALRYKGWNRVQHNLSNFPLAKRTWELVYLLCSALQGEMVYWKQLQKIEQTISLEFLRSLSIFAVVFPVTVLAGLEIKLEEIPVLLTTAYSEIEEDLMALDDILNQLRKPQAVDPDDQILQMGEQNFREVLGRLMARVRPGELFAAMAGHLTQIVRDIAPEDLDSLRDECKLANQVLIDCALYL